MSWPVGAINWCMPSERTDSHAGDIVAYALPNDVDMLYWQLALQEGGFQAIALNPALSGGEIQRIVDHSGAAAIVLHAQFADRVEQMAGTGSISPAGLSRRRNPRVDLLRRAWPTGNRKRSRRTGLWACRSAIPRVRRVNPRPSPAPHGATSIRTSWPTG